MVLAFPCNQFKEQEPGSDLEIVDFCTYHYGVTFPIFSKIEVNGEPVSYTHLDVYKRQDLSTGKHTEFLEPGAPVTENETKAFLEEFRELLPQADIVCISGSVPKGISSDFYGTLIHEATEKGKRVVLDTSGELLIQGVKAVSYTHLDVYKRQD